MISQEKIEEIKNASDIVDVIGGYLALRQAGSSFKGLCPFHQEKTPSFMVNREKQIFHCFGCGQGGNAFTFIQRIENLNFVESVRMLAKRAGINIDEDRNYNATDYSEKEKLLAANKEAINYFHEMFLKSDKAKAYAVSRGLNETALDDFKIGFAPGEGGLAVYLKNKGITEDAAIKSWLVNKGTTGIYDTFRDRFMFPIFNIYGDAIAFGGRAMDDNPAKYINSKETSIYIKGRNLYNLNNARKHTDGTAVIVEGYMDCVSVYSAGIKNVVATLGTAMTADQAKLLKRYAAKAVIMYDMDDAGRQGAVRAGDHLFAEGMDAYVVSFDEVKDPDDYIKKFGVEKLKEKIAKAEPFISYKINQLKKDGDANNSYYKETIIKEVAALISKSDSSIVRGDAVRKTADMLFVQPNVVERYLDIKQESAAQVDEMVDDTRVLSEKGMKLAERNIISAAVNCLGTDDEATVLRHIAERRELAGLKYEDFKNTAYSQIMQKIKAYFNAGEKEILKKIEMDYVDNDDLNSIISELLAERARREMDEKAKDPKLKKQSQDILKPISDWIQKLQKEKAARDMEGVNEAMMQAESSGDMEKLKAAMVEKQRLQKILNQRGGDFE